MPQFKWEKTKQIRHIGSVSFAAEKQHIQNQENAKIHQKFKKILVFDEFSDFHDSEQIKKTRKIIKISRSSLFLMNFQISMIRNKLAIHSNQFPSGLHHNSALILFQCTS